MTIRRKENQSVRPAVEQLEARDNPSGYVTENFDSVNAGQFPANWAQWSSDPNSQAAVVSTAHAFNGPNGLAVNASASNLAARAWSTTAVPADLQSSAEIYLTNLIPSQVFLRGQNLNSASPSYYAVGVTRGLTVELDRVVNGVKTVLGSVTSKQYVSNLWVQATVFASGNTIKAQVVRSDTNQFLTSTGDWQSAPAWAVSVTDTALPNAGLTGLARPASYTGTTYFDAFNASSTAGDTTPPAVQITAPASNATLTGTVNVLANATDNVGVTRVEFYVDGALRNVDQSGPYQWAFDTTSASNGSHTITVKAYDLAGNVGQASLTVTTQNASAIPLPSIPQHDSWIRIAELAYSGTPLTSFEMNLLQNSVDLVVSESSLLAKIRAAAPNTPQLIYSNLSNLYGSLLTDWDAFADAHGLARESAFYHVATATPFAGNSPSSQPVDWFWSVLLSGPGYKDLTTQAHGGAIGGVPFGAVGQSVAVGYPEKFREINVTLQAAAGAGWAGQWEYATAVDANGNPTAWKPLTLLGDTSNGLHQSGTITFDPPADWVAASLNGSARLYFVRLRTTGAGTTPVAQTVLGRDYVNARGGTSGVIPVFDYAADANHDGYLNDAEYAQALRAGDTARFAYEGRLFYGVYGQMRFAVNPSTPGVRAWAADYEKRLLAANPIAAGLFLDNSVGSLPEDPGNTRESTAAFAVDYASLVSAVAQAIQPHWILTNTAGGGTNVNPLLPKVAGYYEEFAIRPLASNFAQFEDLAGEVAQRATLRSPPGYAVLDSLPQGGSPTDPRTQLATLAEYYLLADPNKTFLDLFGGFAPSTSWTQHWIQAAAFNVGQPAGPWSLFASGADPSNGGLTYHIYQRAYANALVLYKPLSYGNNTTGTLADNTATTHQLNGNYHRLNADGSLGPVTRSITLRNGEGAILIKA
jgi:hypothetical protein